MRFFFCYFFLFLKILFLFILGRGLQGQRADAKGGENEQDGYAWFEIHKESKNVKLEKK